VLGGGARIAHQAIVLEAFAMRVDGFAVGEHESLYHGVSPDKGAV
jgi:hypothetical protein